MLNCQLFCHFSIVRFFGPVRPSRDVSSVTPWEIQSKGCFPVKAQVQGVIQEMSASQSSAFPNLWMAQLGQALRLASP